MSESDLPLTVGDVARFLGIETWRVRRAVDALPGEAPRVGAFRVVPRSRLPLLVDELRRRGWLPESKPESSPCA